MSGDELKYVSEALDSNWVAPVGPNIENFERKVQQYLLSVSRNNPGKPINEVVALASGTSAIHLALIGCGVGKGDTVIVQSFTFCASANPITYLGAQPVFVDSEPDTWNIDPELLEQAIKGTIRDTGKKPKAIVVADIYGMPAKMDELTYIASKYGIPIIEDAAEALGSRYKDAACGTLTEYGVLSFNGNKIITTSGGGTLICHSAATKREMVHYATQAKENLPYYQHEHIGYNYRMSNISAGIGLGQMSVLREHIAHHKHVALLYESAFADIIGISFHKATDTLYDSNYWLSTIIIDPNLKIAGQEYAYDKDTSLYTDCRPNPNVEMLRRYLESMGIETRPLWKPLHIQPIFSKASHYTNGISEQLFRTGLCLPSGPLVRDEDVMYIMDCIRSCLKGQY